LDRHVLALNIAAFPQAAQECGQKVSPADRRGAAQQPDDRHRALLRARRERPRGCSAAEQRDEMAPLHFRAHSITSSARASTIGGISRPIAFAVLTLITSVNLVGRSIGKSAALAPLRMRSTYTAARLYMSGRLGP